MALAAILGAVALLAAGCGGGRDETVTAGAPVLTVATALWPLAQAAKAIGQGNVRVVDVVPAGEDPLTYHLTAAETATVRDADVALQVDAGFQPSFADAAGSRVVSVGTRSTDGNPYVWLNPYSMEQVSRTIEAALDRADPKAVTTYRNGLDDFEATLDALDEDYQSILDTCTKPTLVAVDDAFGVLSPRYPVHVVPLDGSTAAPLEPDALTLAREVATTRRAGVGTVYNETWYPGSTLIPLESKTNVKIKSLDTLDGIPPGGFPKGVTSYYDAMESVLGTISNALDCPNPDEED